MIVYMTINAPFSDMLSEKKLAAILKSGKMPAAWSAQISAFFTDVPVQDIMRFSMKYGVSIDRIKTYYEKHVKKLYVNRELEDMFEFS